MRTLYIGLIAVWLQSALFTATFVPHDSIRSISGQRASSNGRDATFQNAEIFVDPRRHTLTLYRDGRRFKTYPIAVGKESTPTPIGDWIITTRSRDWGDGFGTRWLGLNVPWGIYGIHGTNRPSSIGLNASHGCIRMQNRDVEDLYRRVRVGTKVHIFGHVLGGVSKSPRPLAEGDVGPDVLLLQNRLQAAGYFLAMCNGRFGPNTTIALRRYEKAHRLQVDGVFTRLDAISLGFDE